MHIIEKTYRLWVTQILSVVLLLAACTRADIMYVDEPSGWVQIYPDMSEHALPVVRYYFYPVDGQTEYFYLDSDDNGNFEGFLPVGAYRVIATNTTAANVGFSGMDHYETAVVEASPVGSRATGSSYSLLEQPGDVYSTVIEELSVKEGGIVRKEPTPALLTKRLNLVFFMQDGLDVDVVSMSGVLPGVYPAVHLYTHQGEQTGESPGMAVRFETEAADDKRRAQISLFGIYDPARGESYTPILELDLTMADGSTSSKTLDLTNLLSDVIEESGGSIPLELSVSINVKRSIRVDVEVDGWTIEGENKIEETSGR